MNSERKTDFHNKFSRLLKEKRLEVRKTMTSMSGQRRTRAANPDQFDLAADFVSREQQTILQEKMEEQLKQIDAALQRVKEGSFGNCTRCGKPIPEARLEILPHVSLCMECQEKHEHMYNP